METILCVFALICLVSAWLAGYGSKPADDILKPKGQRFGDTHYGECKTIGFTNTKEGGIYGIKYYAGSKTMALWDIKNTTQYYPIEDYNPDTGRFFDNLLQYNPDTDRLIHYNDDRISILAISYMDRDTNKEMFEAPTNA